MDYYTIEEDMPLQMIHHILSLTLIGSVFYVSLFNLKFDELLIQ